MTIQIVEDGDLVESTASRRRSIINDFRAEPVQLGTTQGATSGGIVGGANSPITLDCATTLDWYGSIQGDIEIALTGLVAGETVTLELERHDGSVGAFEISASGWMRTFSTTGMSSDSDAIRVEITKSSPTGAHFMKIHEFDYIPPPPSPTPGLAGIFHLDGSLDNEFAGGFTLASSAATTYVAGQFSQAVKLDATGKISSALIAEATIENGVMIELFAQKLTGSGAYLMSLRNSSGDVVAAIYAAGISSTLAAIGIGISTAIADAWTYVSGWNNHIVLALYKKDPPRPGNSSGCEIAWAHNGVWYETEFVAPNYSGALSVCIADEAELSSYGAAAYDECRVIFGKENFPYQIGVNFAPPVAPFTGLE